MRPEGARLDAAAGTDALRVGAGALVAGELAVLIPAVHAVTDRPAAQAATVSAAER
jgi:hypothetical protein